jgi:hypothetical protein
MNGGFDHAFQFLGNIGAEIPAATRDKDVREHAIVRGIEPNLRRLMMMRTENG